MSLPPFAITWDYRCPFARNAHEHVVEGLSAGADWDVTFLPFSLTQAHVDEGEVDVWDDPARAADLVALEVGVVVRDRYPDHFPQAHRELFAARHDRGGDLRDRAVLADALGRAGIEDPEPIFGEVVKGWPRSEVRKAHELAASESSVFGVPTFIAGDEAAFVRIMVRPEGNGELAVRTVEQIVQTLVGNVDLNEFKRTTVHF